MKELVREKPLVIKFGGTSVGGGAEFARAAAIAADAACDRPLVVVVSAMSGVTNLLLSHAANAPEAGTEASEELRRSLAEHGVRPIERSSALIRPSRSSTS